MSMIAGAHFLFYSTNPDADRAFLRDVLALSSVDAGRGWLIFGLPPSELAVHPADGDASTTPGAGKMLGVELYLMTPDVQAFVASLAQRGIDCAPINDLRWGAVTTFALPSGSRIGVYQPKHPTAIAWPDRQTA
jgi:hypothetical protein